MLHEITSMKVDEFPNLQRWYNDIFAQEGVQHYHKLMIKQYEIEFPENEIDFTIVQ